MTTVGLRWLVFFAFLASLVAVEAFKTSIDAPRTWDEINAGSREKRQIESFNSEDDDFSGPQTQASPEDSGFWDKVVSVALKLFSRFIEWLNSS